MHSQGPSHEPDTDNPMAGFKRSLLGCSRPPRARILLKLMLRLCRIGDRIERDACLIIELADFARRGTAVDPLRCRQPHRSASALSAHGRVQPRQVLRVRFRSGPNEPPFGKPGIRFFLEMAHQILVGISPESGLFSARSKSVSSKMIRPIRPLKGPIRPKGSPGAILPPPRDPKNAEYRAILYSVSETISIQGQ